MTRQPFWVQFTPVAGPNRAQNRRCRPSQPFWVQFTPAAGLNRAPFDGELGS